MKSIRIHLVENSVFLPVLALQAVAGEKQGGFPVLSGTMFTHPAEPQLQPVAEFLQNLRRQLTSFRGQILIHQKRGQPV